MKTSRFILLFIGLVVPFVVAHSSADVLRVTVDDNRLQFTSIQTIEEFLIANITPTMTDGVDDIDPRRTTLSPNGDMLIFHRRDRERSVGMVCEYSFSSNSTNCVEEVEELPDFIGGWWSPDSRYVVLDSDIASLQYMREADLTIYDTQEDVIIYRTDDGVSVREDILADEVRNRVWVDTAPIFAPNGDLYFFRNAIDASVDEWRADLMRIPANEISGTSAPEVIWRHPTIGAYPVFRTSDWFLDGAMSISPDGKYLAIASISLGRPEDTTNGIWLFDLEQQAVKIQIPISRLAEVTSGVPVWITQNMVSTQFGGIIPNSLGWASDSNILVIKASNFLYYTEFFIPPLRYDVTADTLESLYDFTAIPEDGYKPDITLFDEVSISADISISMNVMSPSGQTMFYIGRDAITDTFVLSAISVVESGFTTPRRIATLTDYEPRSRIVTSIGYTAPTLRILTGTTLITLSDQ